MRPVSLYPGEDGYWVAECPSLPGCVSQGETREQALENLREAMQLYIEALEEDADGHFGSEPEANRRRQGWPDEFWRAFGALPADFERQPQSRPAPESLGEDELIPEGGEP